MSNIGNIGLVSAVWGATWIGIGAASKVSGVALKTFGNIVRDPLFQSLLLEGITLCSYSKGVILGVATLNMGQEAYSMLLSGKASDYEGVFYSWINMGLYGGEDLYNFLSGLNLFSHSGWVNTAVNLSTPIGLGFSGIEFLVSSVQAVQSALVWKKLCEINPTNAKQKIEELIGRDEQLWKQAKVSRRTSEKAARALQTVRRILSKGGDEATAQSLLKDVRTLCRRKAIVNGINLAVSLLTITSLTLFLVGFPVCPPLPFALMTAATLLSIGSKVYERYFLERGLYKELDDFEKSLNRVCELNRQFW